MKKYIVSICLSICCVLSLQSQNEDFKHSFSIGVGTNLLQLASFSARLLPAGVRNNAMFHATSSFVVNYDYAFNNRFSLGAGLGVTSGNANYQDAFQFLGKTISGAVRVRYTRVPIQVRGLFHYVNSERLDVYSGLNVGASIWTTKISGNGSANVKDITTQDLKKNLRGVPLGGVLPAIQIIGLGIRYNVTDNIGIGGEVAIGPPSYLSLRVNYRLASFGER